MLKGPEEENQEERAEGSKTEHGEDDKDKGNAKSNTPEANDNLENTPPNQDTKKGDTKETPQTRQKQFQEDQRSATKAKKEQKNEANAEKEQKKKAEEKRKEQERRDKREWKKLKSQFDTERPEFEGHTVEGAPGVKKQLEKEFIRAQRKKDRKKAKKKEKQGNHVTPPSFDEIIEANNNNEPRWGSSKHGRLLRELIPDVKPVAKWDLGSTRQDHHGNIIIELKDRGEDVQIGREEYMGLIHLVKDAFVKAEEKLAEQSHVDRAKGVKKPAIILDFTHTKLLSAFYENTLPALATQSANKGLEFIVLNLDMEPLKDKTLAKLDRHANFHLRAGELNEVSEAMKEGPSAYLGPGF